MTCSGSHSPCQSWSRSKQLRADGPHEAAAINRGSRSAVRLIRPWFGRWHRSCGRGSHDGGSGDRRLWLGESGVIQGVVHGHRLNRHFMCLRDLIHGRLRYERHLQTLNSPKVALDNPHVSLAAVHAVPHALDLHVQKALSVNPVRLQIASVLVPTPWSAPPIDSLGGSVIGTTAYTVIDDRF